MSNHDDRRIADPQHKRMVSLASWAGAILLAVGVGILISGLSDMRNTNEVLRDQVIGLGAEPATVDSPAVGSPGQEGQDGDDGQDGRDGITVVGQPGIDGTNGTDGTDGKDGRDGVSVVGPQGPAGAQGNPGPTGAQGPAGVAGQPPLSFSFIAGGVRYTCSDPDGDRVFPPCVQEATFP